MEHDSLGRTPYATMRTADEIAPRFRRDSIDGVSDMALQHDDLTKREVEILLLLADGLSDREIAEQLVMTINTVKWYNRQIYRILGVGSRTQAISRARELHVISDEHGAAPFSTAGYRTPKHALPVETTHFIGRTRELDAIKRLLDAARLADAGGSSGNRQNPLGAASGAGGDRCVP